MHEGAPEAMHWRAPEARDLPRTYGTKHLPTRFQVYLEPRGKARKLEVGFNVLSAGWVSGALQLKGPVW